MMVTIRSYLLDELVPNELLVHGGCERHARTLVSRLRDATGGEAGSGSERAARFNRMLDEDADKWDMWKLAFLAAMNTPASFRSFLRRIHDGTALDWWNENAVRVTSTPAKDPAHPRGADVGAAPFSFAQRKAFRAVQNYLAMFDDDAPLPHSIGIKVSDLNALIASALNARHIPEEGGTT